MPAMASHHASSSSNGGAAGGLNVIALVSGGKDSFFSALHCLENGHRLVALANLHPPLPTDAIAPESAAVTVPEKVVSVGDDVPPAAASSAELHAGLAGLALDRARPTAARARGSSPARSGSDEEMETDLSSFMYQTVGHEVIPLYAQATGIPLYRQLIVGGAVQSGRDYSAPGNGAGVATGAGPNDGADETESMIPLLRSVMAQHPEANALSAGAILSTYQRTRVESVALRLGLTPLAYLWKYPIHPAPGLVGPRDEAQLLLDMAAAGLDARIIKVASGGLDESFLWDNVASARGIMRLKRAMGRFGSAGMDTGAVLGEGGEFETLVVDGPPRLFKRRLVVDEEDRLVVQEGGGTAWLKATRARTEEKTTSGDDDGFVVRRPNLLDERFAAVLTASKPEPEEVWDKISQITPETQLNICCNPNTSIQTWAVTRPATANHLTIQEETTLLIDQIRTSLARQDLAPTSIISTVIILRSMSDFPAINAVYGSLFTEPNPPSRVTISCGDVLPLSAGNIIIYLAVQTSGRDRQGLHVQSRSYWAPANIGPYSQAISVLAAAGNESAATRMVHIAGQIPLIPASMELPTEGIDMHVALSLQHLWRVGVEMDVRWWTSAAVYFPRHSSSSTLSPRDKAVVAYNAWKEAHQWSSDEDGEDGEIGPDLWDRKYNTQYMTFAGDSGDSEAKRGGMLPDHSVLSAGETQEEEDGEAQNPSSRLVPFFFAAEVDELPRSAAAEWHAHAGLAGLSPSSVHVSRRSVPRDGVDIEHCAVNLPVEDDDETDADTREAGGQFQLHSVVAFEAGAQLSVTSSPATLMEQIRRSGSLLVGGEEGVQMASTPSPYLVYADATAFAAADIAHAIRDNGVPVVPCASIWGGARVARLSMVALYRTSAS